MFFLMKWNVICNAEDRFSCVRAFFAEQHFRSSMHKSLFGASKNTNAVLVQLSNEEIARPQMLKSFFLSERKLLNAILREKLKSNENVSFSWNEMLFAMQKTDFHVLELFCRASHVRASKNTNAVLVQLSKWRDCKATDAEKLLSQWEKVA